MFSFIKFSPRQLDKLADISSDIGLVFLASVVLPAAFDKFSPLAVSLGLFATFIFWIISLKLKR